ncbi:hypothetical protein LTR04_000503, partial [Oleoguttula sp. CCFEE 6159]
YSHTKPDTDAALYPIRRPPCLLLPISPTPVDDSRWMPRNAFKSLSPKEVRLAYIDCPPTSRADVKGTIVLVYSLPQTNYQLRHVITPFSDAGYRVVAPDYRGAGESSKPRSGYTKAVMAEDVFKLLQEHLDIKEKVHIVGHDIGGMRHLARVSAAGTNAYEKFKFTPGVWHFQFHWETDIPEALVYGRERIHIKHFYDRLCLDLTAIAPRDVDRCAASYALPRGMGGQFDVYRAFHQGAEENK